MNYMNRHNLHLDPSADDLSGGGGAAPTGAPAGDAAPAAQVFDAKAFESQLNTRLEEETGRIRGEYEGKFRDLESRIPKPESKEDKEPEMGDFLVNGEMTPESWKAYQAKLNGYHFKQNVSNWEKERQTSYQESKARESVQTKISDHHKRVENYKVANPDFNPRDTRFDRDVALAIASSEFSPHILHFLQKNPDKLAALRELEENDTLSAVRYIGRLESQFENQAAGVDSKITTARTSTTTGAFGTGKGAKSNDLTPEKSREIYG